ncbi:MAG TPA: DUF4253 domain-containing protein [Actinocatenispora sp.]
MIEELAVLFPDGPGDHVLSTPLPVGRPVTPEDGGPPVCWVSDGAAPAGLWATLRAEHPRSGLWPLLVGGHYTDLERPWRCGEVYPADMTAPSQHDPAELLARWWSEVAGDTSTTLAAPYQAWPGLAPGRSGADPDECADEHAELMVEFGDELGIALVLAGSGAEALAVSGWSGPLNHVNDTGQIAAVVASWEQRFGARVIGADFATLYLSVAAPPTSVEQALPIAAEHFAFCPDNIWQSDLNTLEKYAQALAGTHSWSSWWD